MAVGGQAYVFPVGAGPRDDMVIRDSIIGFTIDLEGRVAVVPNPPGIHRAFYPRVVAAADSAFHVLFVTSEPAPYGMSPAADTGTVWYARFRDGAWTEPERIMITRGVRLDPDISSELLERQGELGAVFSFEAASSQGLILLRRTQGAWRTDTLHTTDPPMFADAAYAKDGQIVAAFSMASHRVDPSVRVGLFEARFGSSWSALRRIGGGEQMDIAEVRLVRAGDDIVASWIQWMPFTAETSELHGLTLGGGRQPSRIDAGKHTFPYDVVSSGSGRPAWLTRGPECGTTLNVSMGPGSLPVTFTVPFENPRTASVELDPDRVLALTMKQGKAPDEPMVASFGTILQFRCPEPERRQ